VSVSEGPPHLESDDATPKLESDNGPASAVATATLVPIQTSLPQPSSLLTSFILFRKLPFELRRMIWSDAVSSPRVITIEIDAVFTKPKPADSIGLMSACQESRLMCMEHYKLLQLPPALYQPQISRPLIPFYFSATSDICLLSILVAHHLAETADPTQQAFRDSIRVVALNSLELALFPISQRSMRTRAKYIVSSIAKYSNLQRLVLLRGAGYENEMATLMRELTSDGAHQGLDRIPLVLEDPARITVLPYEYDNPDEARSARKKAILAYAA
jgi:hypothetical protein